jgi:hypothetical protein
MILQLPLLRLASRRVVRLADRVPASRGITAVLAAFRGSRSAVAREAAGEGGFGTRHAGELEHFPAKRGRFASLVIYRNSEIAMFQLIEIDATSQCENATIRKCDNTKR